MKVDSKYIVFLVLAMVVFLAFKLFTPRAWDWTVTFNEKDKNPFGGYLLHQLIQDLYPGKNIHHSYKTLYELYDTLEHPVNFLSISERFSPEEDDTKALLENVSKGGKAFIAAQYYYGPFADTLGFDSDDYYYKTDFSVFTHKEDTSFLHFVNPHLDSSIHYRYPRNNIHQYFSTFDSVKTRVVATNELNLPVTLRLKWGQGEIILCSTPLAFSNAYLIARNNHEFIAHSLSLLPADELVVTEYYQTGRAEAQTPLRFVLKEEPLRWAYFLTLFSLLLFMFFEARRRQRIIPVIKPLENTSLEFIRTIGNLYFQYGDHKNMASKKINLLLEHIRSAYSLNTQKITPDFVHALSKRSGKKEDDLHRLFQLILSVQEKNIISSEELIRLNQGIEKFTQSKHN